MKIKANICTIEITTKKNTTQTLNLEVKQQTVFPHVSGHSASGLDWQADNLFLNYGNPPAKSLPSVYHVSLLRSDKAPEDCEENSWRDYAGFCPNEPNNPNPGEIIYRKEGLGELTGTFEMKRDWSNLYFNRYGTKPPDAITDQIKPAILAHVKKYSTQLEKQAIKKIRSTFAANITDLKGSVKRLEKEAADCITRLNSKEGK